MKNARLLSCMLWAAALGISLNALAHAEDAKGSATIDCKDRPEIMPPFSKNPREREPENLLAAYIQVNTTNPPGCEGKAARFWKAFFDQYGVESTIISLPYGDDRANIIARVRSQSKTLRPFIMLNHLDVVPAEASRWRMPPFSGAIKDGYINGRGTVDMKATAVYQALMLVFAKTENWKLNRDLIFLGTANEEGPIQIEKGVISGAEWMLKNRLSDLDNAEFVLTEGGSIPIKNGKPQTWEISPGEKARLELTFRTPASKQNSPESLLVMTRVAERVLTGFKSPIAVSSKKERDRIAKDSAAMAQQTTTRALTILGGIGKGNTIPSQAEAELVFAVDDSNRKKLEAAVKDRLPKAVRIQSVLSENRTIKIRLIADGIAAHASEPPIDGGVNAILIRTIIALEKDIAKRKLSAKPMQLSHIASVSETKEAVTPQFAIDFRLKPGDSRERVLNAIKALVGNDMEVSITEDAVIADKSSTDTALFRALVAAHDHFERNEKLKSTIETPILTSTTDAAFFRQKGMTVYGFEPLMLDPEDDNSHGDNERILVSSMRFATEVMEFTIKKLMAE